MIRSFAVAAFLAIASPLHAADGPENKVREAIQTLVPGAVIDRIAQAPVPGLYEVVLGGQVVYVSADGRFLLQGTLYDIAQRTDLTEQTRASLRRASLREAGPERRIVFAPENPRHRVTVFTDIDCGYCRRLHQQIDEYNRLGIAIEYLFFPRSGPGTESWEKAVSVWCSDDRKKALTEAKAGVILDKKECSNPVQADWDLGNRIGVNGTPAIYSASGVQLGGYVPPEQLLQRLEQVEGQAGR